MKTLKRLSAMLFALLLFSSCQKQNPLNYKNIRYSSKADKLTLDMYGVCSSRSKPLVVIVHGGGFVFGDKADETGNALKLEEKGFVVACVNYRLTSQVCVNGTVNDAVVYAAMQDVHAAIKFLVANKDRYGIDANQIFLFGTSAGAITVLQLGFAKDKLQRLNDTVEDLYQSVPYHVSGIISVAGGLMDASYINTNIPVVMLHNPSDQLVNYEVGDSHIATCSRKTWGSKYIIDQFDQMDGAYHKLYTVNSYPTQGIYTPNGLSGNYYSHGIGGEEIMMFIVEVAIPFMKTIRNQKANNDNTISIRPLSEFNASASTP